MIVKCPICSAFDLKTDIQVFFDPILKKKYDLNYCKKCDIEFWSPLIMPPSSYYETNQEAYHNMHFGDGVKLRTYHKLFLKKFKSNFNPGSVLEIGCGDGRLLKELKRLGWDIYGLDFDKLSVENAKRKCESNQIYHSSLEEYIKGNINVAKFDLILFFEVLEHQSNPTLFVESASKLLKKDGTIAGSVPNRNRYLFSKRYSPDNPPHHFTLWTARSIKKFLIDRSFIINSIGRTRYEPIILKEIINNVFWKDKNTLFSNLPVNQGPISFKRKIKNIYKPIP